MASQACMLLSVQTQFHFPPGPGIACTNATYGRRRTIHSCQTTKRRTQALKSQYDVMCTNSNSNPAMLLKMQILCRQATAVTERQRASNKLTAMHTGTKFHQCLLTQTLKLASHCSHRTKICKQ
eukprot:gnl/MRDRNA2_/MRDRNA2_78227_c0_seq1.p2 gnl/MRDRNA2_/MRDRNA2_78227_c0~~gnl/MRDRNA2_/MRDRNA2_78227_c0_seq1.p2  ORF type:complete len:132 (-),score=8.44 gnl/MRDRNA2_/MRDRNA2_78227_c0_seq1:1082-1453(-)